MQCRVSGSKADKAGRLIPPPLHGLLLIVKHGRASIRISDSLTGKNWASRDLVLNVWMNVSALTHGSLSANTVVEDHSTRKPIHQDFLNSPTQMFHLGLESYNSMVDMQCAASLWGLLFLSLIALLSTRSHCPKYNLCPSALFLLSFIHSFIHSTSSQTA